MHSTRRVHCRSALFLALAFCFAQAAEARSPLLIEPTGLLGIPGFCKGMAFDGTNFLAGLQWGGNNEVGAQFIYGSGALPPAPIDFGHTGSPPLVAFNGVNYLLVWADSGSPTIDIHGQFVDRSGSLAGTPFLIQPDADTVEVGGIDFDGVNFLVVWAANSLSKSVPSMVQGQRISATGELVGEAFQINTSAEDHQFPVLAFDGTNHLVCWEEQTGDTKLWNVGGRFVSKTAALLDELMISEQPATNLHPIGIGFGRTNYLVTWSREVGPFLNTDYSPMWYLPTNLWYPMVHGRLVSTTATLPAPEFQVSRGKWRQTAPAVAFDGTNYLISWLDGRYVINDWNGVNSQLTWGSWKFLCRLIDQAGEMREARAEFGSTSGSGVYTNYAQALASFPSGNPPVVVMGKNRFLALFLYARLAPETIGQFLVEASDSSPSLQNIRAAGDGTLQVDLVGVPNQSYSIEVSTNSVDWNLLYLDVLRPWWARAIPGTLSLPAPQPISAQVLYRGLSGGAACADNLRMMRDAKDQWALEHAKSNTDFPLDTELFGPGKYLPSKPKCPNGGTYTVDNVGYRPTCNLGNEAGHTY